MSTVRPWQRIVMVVVGLACAVGPGASAAQPPPPGLAYVLSAPEISLLLDGRRVESREREDQRWAASMAYTVGDDDLELVISARVLPDSGEARRFAAEIVQLIASDREKADVRRASDDEAANLGVDELADARLLYVDEARQKRVSNYARLLRSGRAVVLLEAIGSPEADDAQAIDNDRALALVRAFDLVVGKVHFYPPDFATPRPELEPFARDWARHGFGLSVDPTGHGLASWRVYTWCSDLPAPPCDEMTNSVITGGGSAAMVFFRANGATADGIVIGTTQAPTLSLGRVTLTVDDQGMARLKQGGTDLDLCGPDFLERASEKLRATFPCGA